MGFPRLTLLVLALSTATVEQWMQQGFYPVLFVILFIAGLGFPLPEDVPLITAGVLLNTHADANIATWPMTLAVALVGIMSGDVVLYHLGRRWGTDVVSHRFVSWIITPSRFQRMTERFQRWGIWLCFFGRFFMGIRAAMCLTAGATRFSFWRFFTADFCGALLSVPFFVGLGYWFGGMIPTIKKYVAEAQLGVLALIAIAVIAYVVYEVRKIRRTRRQAAEELARQNVSAVPNKPATPETPASTLRAGPSETLPKRAMRMESEL